MANDTAAVKKMAVRSQTDRDLSHQMLGAAKYASYLNHQTASDRMRFLIGVRDEKRYLDYDCNTFDEFLDSVHSPISSSAFYRKVEFFKKEDPLQYDLLEQWKIPVRLRRLLTDGDWRIDGDDVYLGDELVEPGASPTIVRQMLDRLVKDRIGDKKKIEGLEGYKGRYEKLKAEVDEIADKPEYVIAFMQFLEAFKVLIAEVKDLPGEMKGERGPDDLPQICILIEQLVREYGEPLPWVRGSWDFERPNRREQEKLPYFQSDAIDGDNF